MIFIRRQWGTVLIKAERTLVGRINSWVGFGIIEGSREAESEINVKREKQGSPTHIQLTSLRHIDEDLALSITE